jgi:hypothetical protein
LLCEDFPHSHNLVLIGQPPLLQALALSINEEIRSRVTYSVILPRLSPEAIEAFILSQLDRVGLGHNTFTPEASMSMGVIAGDAIARRRAAKSPAEKPTGSMQNLNMKSLIVAFYLQAILVTIELEVLRLQD